MRFLFSCSSPSLSLFPEPASEQAPKGIDDDGKDAQGGLGLDLGLGLGLGLGLDIGIGVRVIGVRVRQFRISLTLIS